MTRLSMSNIAWQRCDEEAAAALAEAGLDGVEIAPTVVWDDPVTAAPAEIRRYRRWWRDRGLPVVALQSLLYGTTGLELFGDDGARDALIARVEGMCRVAAELEASALVFGSPRNRRRGPMSEQAADEIAVDTFGHIASMAAGLGVAVCLEANPTEYDADWMIRAAHARRIVETVDSPGLRLHLDAACMLLAGDDPTAEVTAGVAALAHVHVSEPQLGTVSAEEIDNLDHHRAFAQALREVDYAGYASVEMRPDGDPPDLDRVARAAAFVRDVYA